MIGRENVQVFVFIRNPKFMVLILKSMREFCYATEVKEEKAIRLSNEHEEYIWCTEEEAKRFLKWHYNLFALNKLFSLIRSEYKD
jgi:hypothetical protein